MSVAIMAISRSARTFDPVGEIICMCVNRIENEGACRYTHPLRSELQNLTLSLTRKPKTEEEWWQFRGTSRQFFGRVGIYVCTHFRKNVKDKQT